MYMLDLTQQPPVALMINTTGRPNRATTKVGILDRPASTPTHQASQHRSCSVLCIVCLCLAGCSFGIGVPVCLHGSKAGRHRADCCLPDPHASRPVVSTDCSTARTLPQTLAWLLLVYGAAIIPSPCFVAAGVPEWGLVQGRQAVERGGAVTVRPCQKERQPGGSHAQHRCLPGHVYGCDTSCLVRGACSTGSMPKAAMAFSSAGAPTSVHVRGVQACSSAAPGAVY